MCTKMSETYPWKVIDPKDSIRLELTEELTLKDVHVLTRLYQPLIGAAATSMYLMLYSDITFQAEAQTTSVSEMLTKLDIGIPEFYNARVKLEGIGLLNIYRSNEEEKSYLYEVVAPLSAEGFFADSLLRTLLSEKIGTRLFNEQWETLLKRPSDKSAYEETTRSFLDVYHVDFEKTNFLDSANTTSVESVQRPKLVQTIENTDSFDYSFFKAGLGKHFIKQDSLTDEVKELIYTFHTVYGIDEMTMQSLILESTDVDSGVVNKNRFTRNVQRNFQNKAKIKAPAVVEKAAESISGEFSESEMTIIRHAKQTAPAVYLQSIKEQKGGFVTTNEQWVLKELVEQSPLPKETINILLNYILIGRENPTLEKNYTMKIANDWAQSGVRSAEEAITKIKDIYTQPKTQTTRQGGYQRRNYNNREATMSRAEAKLPEWAKDNQSIESVTDESVSQEAAESYQERLARLRKSREEKRDN